jgi:hypothetical protein
MGDRLRIVSIPRDGRAPLVLRDLADGESYSPVRDSFTVTPPNAQAIQAALGGRWGGKRVVAESHENGAVGFRLRVSGATADAALASIEELLDAVDAIWPGLFLEWRPEGATQSTFYELRGPASWDSTYRWIVFSQTRAAEIGITLPVAPLAQGASMDVWEDFSQPLDAWVADEGSGTYAIANEALTATTTAVKVLHHASGYELADVAVELRFTTGAAPGALEAGALLSRINGSNFLMARASGSSLTIYKRVAGTYTQLATLAITALAAASTYWLRFRREANALIAEHWITEPYPAGDPGWSLVHNLSAADAALFPAEGEAGIRWAPSALDQTIDDVRIEPFTYGPQGAWPPPRSPAHLLPRGEIPGNAPALVDLDLWSENWTAHFGLVGWTGKPAPFNLVGNGGFEDLSFVTWGWSAAAVAGITAAATSITRVTSVARDGGASGQIVTPGSAANEGASFAIYRRFRKGRTYTAKVYAFSSTSTATVQVALGVSGDLALSTAAALSAGWVAHTVTWTPTADVEVGYLAVRTGGTAAATFQIDSAMAFEGTIEPRGLHATGLGSVPPFGLLEGGAASKALGTLTADANASGGYRRGGYFGQTLWYVDPSLLPADDFGEEIEVEVWAAVVFASTLSSVKLVLSASPERTDGQLTRSRYSDEYGSVGKTLTVDAASSARRLTRLGTLRFSRGGGREALMVMQTALTGSGEVSFDHLIVVPIKRRAASPTGKTNASGNDYPRFMDQLYMEKRINADLSGEESVYATATKRRAPRYLSTGLGGSSIEIEPGEFEALIRLSNLAPDDPTVNNSSENSMTTSFDFGRIHFAVTPRYRLARG